MTTTLLATSPGADLASWSAHGDRAALERALSAAAEPAYAQALRLLGRAADAEDATQEALVQLTRSAKRYDPTRPFAPWLARIVHDACCRLLRSNRRRRRHEAAAPPVEVPSEPQADTEVVRAAVLELPEPLRAAIELHYFAGLSQAEAATSLGIAEDACAKRLSRARERLRHLLVRRGCTVTAGVALAMLTATPAHAAPPAIAAGIAAQAAGGTLPATTIPLNVMQRGVWLMQSHPIASCLIALGLAVVLTPCLLPAAEAAPPGHEAVAPATSKQVQIASYENNTREVRGPNGELVQTGPAHNGDGKGEDAFRKLDETIDKELRNSAASGNAGPAAAVMPAGMAAKLARPVTVAFLDTTLNEAVAILKRQSDLDIVLDPGLGQLTVSLDLKGMRLERVLHLLEQTSGLTHAIDGDIYRIRQP